MSVTGRRSGFVGTTDDGDEVYVEIELECISGGPRETITHEVFDGTAMRLSVSGHYYDKRAAKQKNDWTGGGQCVEKLRAVTPLAGSWTLQELTELADMWDRWHLNDMRAGCVHQTPSKGDARHQLTTTPPCPETGYRWGHAWLYEPLPVDVVEQARRFRDKLDGTE